MAVTSKMRIVWVHSVNSWSEVYFVLEVEKNYLDLNI